MANGRFSHMKVWVAAGVAVPAAALTGGIAAETAALFGELWIGALTVIVPLLLLLTGALAAGFAEGVNWLTAVVSGALAGCIAGVMFVVGAVLPFALKVGQRDLTELGGDVAWEVALAGGLIIYGVGGAALGAACGAVARTLKAFLAHKRIGSQPKEAR